MNVLRKGRKLECAVCGRKFYLSDKALGERDRDGVLRITMPVACTFCGAVERHAVESEIGGQKVSEKADRVQSTMRYDPPIYAWITKLSQESGLSVSDLANEMFRLYMNDPNGLTKEVVDRMLEPQEEG